jgi:hypothetical protein
LKNKESGFLSKPTTFLAPMKMLKRPMPKNRWATKTWSNFSFVSFWFLKKGAK